MQLTSTFANYLTKVKDAGKVRRGVDEIMAFYNLIPAQYRSYINPSFKGAFDKISKAQSDAGNKELTNYINGLIK